MPRYVVYIGDELSPREGGKSDSACSRRIGVRRLVRPSVDPFESVFPRRFVVFYRFAFMPFYTRFPPFCPSFIFATNLFLHIAQTTNVSLIYFMSFFYALLSRAPFLFHPHVCFMVLLQTLFFLPSLNLTICHYLFVCQSVNLSVSQSV